MKIAIIQSNLFWENPAANRDYFEEKINGIVEQIDLVVLPEMFTTGFTMNPAKVAETLHGDTTRWMKNLSKSKNFAITGSLTIEDNGKYYNRLLFVFPDGNLQWYDKRHLFGLAGESQVYTAGSKKIIVDYRGWKICPLICYDLRFPVFSRNKEDYDALLYVANWPIQRVAAWDILLKARAIENMCYAIGVNRIGTDLNNTKYTGHSQVVDFFGNEILFPQETENVFIVALSKEKLIEARKRFPFLNDSDDFDLKS